MRVHGGNDGDAGPDAFAQLPQPPSVHIRPRLVHGGAVWRGEDAVQRPRLIQRPSQTRRQIVSSGLIRHLSPWGGESK